MKPFKLLFAAIAVMITGMLNTASAADIYTPPTPDEVLVANDGVDWTGFYAGLSGGGVFTNTELSIQNGPSVAEGLGSDGLTGCLYGGYDHQFANSPVILGVWGEGCLTNAESDIGGFKIEHTHSFAVGPRLGAQVWDGAMVYAKTGIRWGFAKANEKIFDNHTDDSEVFTGWLVGVGTEQRIGGNWVVGVDVDYTNYQTRDVCECFEADPEALVGTLRAGYRF